jgi:hypothetical protein
MRKRAGGTPTFYIMTLRAREHDMCSGGDGLSISQQPLGSNSISLAESKMLRHSQHLKINHELIKTIRPCIHRYRYQHLHTHEVPMGLLRRPIRSPPVENQSIVAAVLGISIARLYRGAELHHVIRTSTSGSDSTSTPRDGPTRILRPHQGTVLLHIIRTSTSGDDSTSTPRDGPTRIRRPHQGTELLHRAHKGTVGVISSSCTPGHSRRY